MTSRLIAIAILSLLFTGCASVSMTSKEASNKAKEFNTPTNGNSGVYIYRTNSAFGGALKKDIWIDGDCIGETAPGIFFYEEVSGNDSHTLSTESEFSPNNLVLEAISGENYFVEQYIKIGAFVGGANLKQVDTETGKAEVLKLEMAVKGHCSK
ncbi:MAG: DUF2846 domain-containing protein [Candidatus Thiodiazotropha sp.]